MLLNVPLLGAEKMDVESLPSYLYRTSYHYGFSVGEFCRLMLSHAKHLKKIPADTKLPTYIFPGHLVGQSKPSRCIRDLLELSTGQSLSKSCLWILTKSLGVSNGEFAKNFRWCPECFSEMKRMGSEPYFKLIWSMASVTACPIHRTPYEEFCGACGATQNTYIRNRPADQCQKCFEPLSIRYINLKPEDIAPSWMDIGSDIVEMFTRLGEIPERNFKVGGPYQSLHEVSEIYYKQGRIIEFNKILPHRYIREVMSGQSKLALITARRLAFRLGVSLYDFLSGAAGRVTHSLDAEVFCALAPGYLEARPKMQKDHKSIVKKAKYYIEAQPSPPSLKEIAKALGVSVGYFEYRHPALVSHWVATRKHYEETEKIRRQNLATQEALSFFLGEKYQTENRSKRNAYRTLRDHTSLSKTTIMLGISRAHHSLFDSRTVQCASQDFLK